MMGPCSPDGRAPKTSFMKEDFLLKVFPTFRNRRRRRRP